MEFFATLKVKLYRNFNQIFWISIIDALKNGILVVPVNQIF